MLLWLYILLSFCYIYSMAIKLPKSNIFILSLIFVSILSFCGAGVYLVYKLDYFGVFLSLFLAIIGLFLIIRYLTDNKQAEKNNQIIAPKKITFKAGLAAASYLIFWCLAGAALFKNQTTAAIISPWDVLGSAFFYYYAGATLALLALIFLKNKFTLLFAVLHYFLTFSVALVVYKLGFGYDPFIHLSSLHVIDDAGFIAPKTVYYLGQYSLEIILHKLFFIPLDFLNRILVPLAAAVTLPPALYLSCRERFGDKNISRLLLPAVLVLPTSIFIMTVPQNLAYLFLLLAVILSFGKIDKLKLAAIISLSLAALMTQLLAGIPAILFAAYAVLNFLPINKTLKTIKSPIILVVNFLIIPLLLIFFVGAHFHFAWSNFNFFDVSLAGNENFVLNFIYFLAQNKVIILLAAIFCGAFIACKNKAYRHYFYFFASSFLAYLLAGNLSFSDLAESEQGNYPERILVAALIFLLPLILVFFKELIVRVQVQAKPVKLIWALVLLILISTSLYLSYPRQDRYFNSRGYSVSAADKAAAESIAAQAADSDYVVLANQQVGAAAISLYGLKKYYHGDIFYYSTQTGGRLYQYYLQMAAAPQRDTMLAAMDYVGVDEAYFVLDKYWWASAKILAEAKLSADNFWDLNDGEVYVFRYKK